MAGYTKLFSTIISSTIWREPKETKVLWITMLAMATKDGEVEASIPGLAHLAGLTVDETELALRTLLAPDPFSRSKENAGRRIETIDGGWVLINHAKYRAAMSQDDRREYMKLHMRAKRSKDVLANVSTGLAPLTQAEAEAKEDPLPIPAEEQVYAAYPKKVGRKEALRAIAKALKANTADKLLERTKAYAEAVANWPTDDMRFVPHPATWFNQGRYDDDPEQWNRVETNGKRAGWLQ